MNIALMMIFYSFFWFRIFIEWSSSSTCLPFLPLLERSDCVCCGLLWERKKTNITETNTSDATGLWNCISMWQYHYSFPRKYYISTNLILQWNYIHISIETDICNDLEKLNRSYIISKTRIEFLETPVEWQSIRLIKSVVLFSSETISFPPSMFVFFDMHVLGMLVASGRKSQMAIAHTALLLHAFYPFTQNKINS